MNGVNFDIQQKRIVNETCCQESTNTGIWRCLKITVVTDIMTCPESCTFCWWAYWCGSCKTNEMIILSDWLVRAASDRRGVHKRRDTPTEKKKHLNMVIFLSALWFGHQPKCWCVSSQGHGTDEEAAMRRHQVKLPWRATSPASVGQRGDPHQPGVGVGLSGPSQIRQNVFVWKRWLTAFCWSRVVFSSLFLSVVTYVSSAVHGDV